MKYLYAFGWIPVPVYYVDEIGLPAGFGGVSHHVLIKILHRYRDDVGLHEHELEHCEQAYRLLILGHLFLRGFSLRYRQWSEVSAYKRQIACYPKGTSVEFAVTALTQKYGFNIYPEEARKLLLEGAA